MFETAVVEAGELRADSPDRERLTRVKEWLRKEERTAARSAGDLLTTGKETFLASHKDQKGAAERAYLSELGAGVLPDVRAPRDRHPRRSGSIWSR